MAGSASAISIVNVGYRSTNYWVISAGRSRLLVDLGWPGMMNDLLHALQRADIPLSEIRAGFATHYHIDHAGAAEDLKQRGMPLWVFEEQVAHVDAMAAHIKPGQPYTPIRAGGNLVLRCADSRAKLAALGIAGEVVPTPGHSDDSVSLVLDSGECFIGDLTLEKMIGNESPEVVRASWDRLRAMGAHTVYAGHVKPYPMPSSVHGD